MPIHVLDEFQADNEIVQIVQDETGTRWAQARRCEYPVPIAWRELDDTEVLIERIVQLRGTIGGMHASIPYELPAPPQEPIAGSPEIATGCTPDGSPGELESLYEEGRRADPVAPKPTPCKDLDLDFNNIVARRLLGLSPSPGGPVTPEETQELKRRLVGLGGTATAPVRTSRAQPHVPLAGETEDGDTTYGEDPLGGSWGGPDD